MIQLLISGERNRGDYRTGLGFVKQEQTPSEQIEFGIQFHLAGLSLSNTVPELETFGVERSQKAVAFRIDKSTAEQLP